jgi:hypothetical protein
VMAEILPQAMTISPMQRRLAIEALAACCAVYAADGLEVMRATGAFCQLVRDPATRKEAEELLKKLAAMATA